MSLILSVAPPNASGQESKSTEPPWRLDEVMATGRLGSLHLAETNHRRASDRFTLTNADTTVQFEVYPNLDRESAEILIKDNVMGIHALYADALSPYPGDISNRIVTGQRFKPEYREKTEGEHRYRYFLLYANDRFAYGATAKDSAHFRSLLGWIYCGRDSRLYKVRFFAPADTPGDRLERWFLRLTCR
jgi:hypothetical protein